MVYIKSSVEIATLGSISEEEMSYVKQGEDALQKAISILSDQEGWTVESVAVSIETTDTQHIKCRLTM